MELDLLQMYMQDDAHWDAYRLWIYGHIPFHQCYPAIPNIYPSF